MKKRAIVALLMVTLLIPLASSLLVISATTISATDPTGDVSSVTIGGQIPPQVISAADLTSAQLTFTETSVTVSFEVAGEIPTDFMVNNYSLYFYADIMGQYNGQSTHLIIGAGSPPGFSAFGYSFAIIEDDDGNGLAFYYGDSVSVQVSGSSVSVTAPIGTSSFIPTLGDTNDPSMVYSGALISGTMSGGASDDINLYLTGTITGGETTTPPQETTTPPQTTTTPPEEVSNPMDEEPTTADVTVSIGAPNTAHITLDTTNNLASINIEGEGSTSGAAPDHVGIAIIAILKDGNVSYTWINGDMNWDPDNNPSNGYAFTMQYMSYSIDLEITPTGPAENPWASFSYSFKGTVPANYIGINYGLSQVNRFYILARAYLDRDETLWNQAYAEFSPTTGTGEVTEPPTQTTQTSPTTTSQVETGEGTTTTSESYPNNDTGSGLNPLLIGGVVAIAIVAVAALFLIKRR